jgi:hypothetical protein
MGDLERVLEQRIGARRLAGLKAALEADWGEEISTQEELRDSATSRR